MKQCELRTALNQVKMPEKPLAMLDSSTMKWSSACHLICLSTFLMLEICFWKYSLTFIMTELKEQKSLGQDKWIAHHSAF